MDNDATIMSPCVLEENTPGGAMQVYARTDVLTEQRVNVALIYQLMLGTEDAETYLISMDVPMSVIDRVLRTAVYRRTVLVPHALHI
jgi:hypothetical protein